VALSQLSGDLKTSIMKNLNSLAHSTLVGQPYTFNDGFNAVAILLDSLDIRFPLFQIAGPCSGSFNDGVCRYFVRCVDLGMHERVIWAYRKEIERLLLDTASIGQL